MNLIILGQQGSGKGTQAELLADKFNLEHIDVGKGLREVAESDTPIGREIFRIQNVEKTLVPSKILKEILHVKLNSLSRKKGLVIDGAPRTLEQVQYLEEALQEVGRKITQVIFINIPADESIKRISARWICEKCKETLIMGKDVKKESDICPKCFGKIKQRDDDTFEGIKKRLKVFENETLPVINYFKEKNISVEISGMDSIEKVFENILKNIKLDD